MPNPTIALSIDTIKQLPTTGGVYIVRRESEIVYIGQTQSFRPRFRNHFHTNRFGALEPLHVELISVSSRAGRFDMEAALIREHMPRLNIQVRFGVAHRFSLSESAALATVMAAESEYLETLRPYNNAPAFVWINRCAFTGGRTAFAASPVSDNGTIEISTSREDAYVTSSQREWVLMKLFLRAIPGSNGAHERRIQRGVAA